MTLAPLTTRYPRGFTLLEVLVAISIFAVLISAIGSVFYSALRMRNSTTAAINNQLPIEDALNAIRHDLANIVAPNSNGLFCGSLQTLNITNALPGQAGPDFYTSNGELDGITPWGNIEKLDYVLAAPTNGTSHVGKDLYRAVTRNLLPVTGQLQPDERQFILGGVQNMTFTYYDGNAWQTSWDTTQVTNLPFAIKVQLQMVGDKSSAPSLQLVVPIDILLNTNASTTLMQ